VIPIVLAALGALVLVGCKRISPECRAHVQRLRERIAAIDWSTVPLYERVPYTDIPVGEGRSTSDDTGWDPVIVQGTIVNSYGHTHADDASLHAWLYESAGILRNPSITGPLPLYLIPTKDTRLGLVRRVAATLKQLGELRLGVRPAHVEEPWRPRKDRQAFYDHKTRRVPPARHKKWNEELIMSVLVPAEGCSEAVEVATYPTMSPGNRLKRLPDAFEQCGCDGDMDTLAALYWFQTFEGHVPLRWHAWDDALAEQLGDDATYAELARVLTERYLASRAPKK
jgi:hypothetical protein